MEIKKTNENFSLSETLDNGWKMNGSANNEVNGSISINFSINTEGELYQEVATCSYSKHTSSDKSYMNLNVTESNKDEVWTYFNSVVNTVLNHFDNN